MSEQQKETSDWYKNWRAEMITDANIREAWPRCPSCRKNIKNLEDNGRCRSCNAWSEDYKKWETTCIKCKKAISNNHCDVCDHQQCSRCSKKTFLIDNSGMCCTCYEKYNKCLACLRQTSYTINGFCHPCRVERNTKK